MIGLKRIDGIHLLFYTKRPWIKKSVIIIRDWQEQRKVFLLDTQVGSKLRESIEESLGKKGIRTDRVYSVIMGRRMNAEPLSPTDIENMFIFKENFNTIAVYGEMDSIEKSDEYYVVSDLPGKQWILR